MAYATPIDSECTEAGYGARATYEVRNGRNETMRRCCERHAHQLVRKLSADEDRVRLARAPDPR